MTDLAILGGGPAGLTAAIYAARAGSSVIILEKESFGGQITQAGQVDNFPGLPGISGMELGDRMLSQAMDAGARMEFTEVTSVDKLENGRFFLKTEDGALEAGAVIFAGGARPRTLGLPRETELIGQGISYCALCDGAFFEGQDVAVVGGGSTAFSDALLLSHLCRSVTLLHRREGFRAEARLVDAARNTENIRFLTSSTVTALLGQKQLEGLAVQTPDGAQQLHVQALFAALGRVPDCRLVQSLCTLDDQGYILAAEDCRTETPGFYAAGDCRRKTIRQLTTAMADGTCAAIAACDYLDSIR